jgi:hypothetical protein
MPVKNYYVQTKDEPGVGGFFFVEEKIEELPRSDILQNWKKSIPLKRPVDLFNDKINYNCTSFQDICTINEGMLGVVDKFLFLDPKRAQSELEKIKHNFEVLKESLREVEGIFNTDNDFSKSYLEDYKKEVENLNNSVNHMLLNPNVIFGPQFSWQIPSTSHHVVKNRASLIDYQCGCLLSNKGYSTGVHKFKVSVITRTSTCMIGVAPETVSKNSVNYSSNGFFCNLNGGTLYSGPPMSHGGNSYISGGIAAGAIVTITLNCDLHTLSYMVDGRDCGVAFTGLPSVKLFLAFDNNTTGGSSIELI